MMRVMIDYCIGFYERRRESEDLEQKADTQKEKTDTQKQKTGTQTEKTEMPKDDPARKLSIRQIFSNHINYVVSAYTGISF